MTKPEIRETLFQIEKALRIMEEHHRTGPFKVIMSKEIYHELSKHCAFPQDSKDPNLTILGCKLQIEPGLPYAFAVTKDIELDLDSDEGYMGQD